MKKSFIWLLPLGSLALFCHAQTTCSSLNYDNVPTSEILTSNNLHISGYHEFSDALADTCYYTPATPHTQYCQTQNVTYSGVTPYETGGIAEVIGFHVSQTAVYNGTSTGNGSAGNYAATGTAVASFEYCLIPGCFFTVTASPISFPPTAIWSESQSASFTCVPKADPQYLSSISVTPASASIAAGHSQQFTATGNYSGAEPRISPLHPPGPPPTQQQPQWRGEMLPA